LHAKDSHVTYYFPEQVEASREVCLEEFKHKMPDAVFCMGDMILMGVMHAVHEAKLKVQKIFL
jgi:DNA-binding LacI/PurR family transcriptional regulator